MIALGNLTLDLCLKSIDCDFFDGNMIHAMATNDKHLKLKERRMFSGAVTYSMIQDDHLPFYNLGIRFQLLVRIKK